MVAPVLKQLAAAAFLAQSLSLASASALPLQARDEGAKPNLPHASDTTPYCSWWSDFDGSKTCEEFIDWSWIDLKSFYRWNPSVGSDCSGIKTANSYCVEVQNEPALPPEETKKPTAGGKSSTTSKPVTTKATPTTTKAKTTTSTTKAAGNGVETPDPVQGDMVDNCSKFHLVESGESCDAIAKKYGLTLAQFTSFNGLNGKCTDLWGDTYACVGLIGGNPSVTGAPAKTTTAPGNGVKTPEPVHNGIVKNCNKFYLVKDGDSCASIAKKGNVAAANIVAWNGLNKGCTNIWLDTHACIGIIGGKPPATTTKKTTTIKAGSGIQTPTPTQPGMVGNCNKFHKVGDGDSCAKIASANRITVAQFTKWNGLDRKCSNLWGKTYACVRIVGFTPTVTTKKPTTTKKPGNGIKTPTPTQGKIVANCKKFELVRAGDTCEAVAKRRRITVKQLTTWNPSIGRDCKKLWSKAYACVGV